ncbi:radial spoke head protein 3 homolog [Xyrauchen texanus]|uniref:radial spoke head protein 3 homolog n=1 Tax=Xyrauchen texanus TaxID=154827 RepID=UPI002241AF25|nr:radial spoke head protein 3 homolog [Xyrauchen texanus]
MTSTLQPQNEVQSGVYTFSSRPRPVPSRPKYRNSSPLLNEEQGSYGNIMYDRHVVRGNTYSQNITSQPNPVEFLRQQETRRKSMSRKSVNEHFGLKMPDPLEARKNIDVQIETYLEELSDHIEDASMECQTDMFLEKPATPLFIPAKTGQDAATQIEEGELFDFDVEVQPVLQVLVGKTIEQALLEVEEEEELASLRSQQWVFKEIHDAELVEVQRLEERERRLRVEEENRIKQQKAVLEKEKETAEKIAARAFAQQYMSDLLPPVFYNLRDSGYFYDPVKRDLETKFLPWLMKEVNNTLELRYVARTVLDMLIQDSSHQRLKAFQLQE